MTKRRRHCGGSSRACVAAQLRDCQREYFPEKGDTVLVHSQARVRTGVITAVRQTRTVADKPGEFRYDIQLASDGSWLPDELRTMRRLFDRVDVDGSGAIDVGELQALLRQLGHPDAESESAIGVMFDRVDVDRSDTMDFDEFKDLVYVELKQLIGLETELYDVPPYRLKRRLKHFSKPVNIFQVGPDPFGPLVRAEREARLRRRVNDRAALVDAASQPHKRVDKAPLSKPRELQVSCTESRLQLARNVFTKDQYDCFSKPPPGGPSDEHAPERIPDKWPFTPSYSDKWLRRDRTPATEPLGMSKSWR